MSVFCIPACSQHPVLKTWRWETEQTGWIRITLHGTTPLYVLNANCQAYCSHYHNIEFIVEVGTLLSMSSEFATLITEGRLMESQWF